MNSTLVAKPTDEITREIIGASISVHSVFGPGLLEKAYIPPLLWELEERGIRYEAAVPLDIAYRGRTLERAYLIDVIVEDLVVVEVRSVEALLPVHVAQTITYARLAQNPAGLLITST